MESKLETANCLDVYAFGKQHMCEHLTSKSKEFIARHFTELIRTREFVEIDDIELLVDVLGCDELEVASEEVVVEAVLGWLKHKPDDEQRRAHAQRLLTETIRLSFVDSAYLTETMRKYDDQNMTLAAAVRTFFGALLAKQLENKSVENSREEKPRAGMAKAQLCFLLVGGWPDTSSSSYSSSIDDESSSRDGGGVGVHVNCFNPFNGDKYFFSTSYLNKPSYDGKGFFHVEYPGKMFGFYF